MPMVLLLFAASAQATCVADVLAGDILADVLQAEEAWRELDVERLNAAHASLEVHLPCLTDRIGRDLAANVHRVQALHAMSVNDGARGAAYFIAARSLVPSYHFPEDLVPSDNVVRTVYDNAPVGTIVRSPVEEPAIGSIEFDGVVTDERPTNVPTVFQIIDGSGRAIVTQYLEPGSPLPYYKQRVVAAPPAPVVAPAAVPSTPAVAPATTSSTTTVRRRKNTAGIVAGSIVGGVGLAGLVVGGGTMIKTIGVCSGDVKESLCRHFSSNGYNYTDNYYMPYLVGGGIAAGVGLTLTVTGIAIIAGPSSVSVSATF